MAAGSDSYSFYYYFVGSAFDCDSKQCARRYSNSVSLPTLLTYLIHFVQKSPNKPKISFRSRLSEGRHRPVVLFFRVYFIFVGMEWNGMEFLGFGADVYSERERGEP